MPPMKMCVHLIRVWCLILTYEAIHAKDNITVINFSLSVTNNSISNLQEDVSLGPGPPPETLNCTGDEQTACEHGVGSTISPESAATMKVNCDDKSIPKNGTADITDCISRKVPPVSVTDQGLLTKSQLSLAEIICRYLYYVLLASAVCANVINIVVYTESSMKSPTSTYLIALSVNELLFSFLSIFRPILNGIYGVDAIKKQLYLISAMYISNFALATLRRLMYCLTVLVSTERFLAVAFPLRARNFRLIKSPTIFIVAMTIVCFLCHVPGALKFDVIQKPNSTDYTIKPSDFYLNNKDLLLTFQMVVKVIYAYVVLFLGLLMNLFVLVALKMHTKNRQKMNTSVDTEKAAKRERQTTITILTSTFLFTILALPLATDSIVQTFMPDYNLYRKEHYMNLLMKEVNGVLILFSLSTDFVFYMLLSKAYRRTFFRRIPFMATIFRRKKYTKQTFQSPETNISKISSTKARDSCNPNLQDIERKQ